MEALGFLVDVRCEDKQDMSGFTLSFHFSENPFFTNTCLTKVYEVGSLLGDEEPELEKVTGTDIDWKEGKCLTFETKEKKQRAKKGKNKGQTRIVQEKVKRDSFFHFFSPPDVAKLSELEDSEEAEAMMEQFNMDYSVAFLLRSEVVPQAVLCFTGELADSDDEDDDDYDDDDDDDDDDDSDDEVDSDEDAGKDAGAPKRGKRGGKGGKGGSKGGGKTGGKGGGKGAAAAFPGGGAPGAGKNPEECKQS